MTRKTRSRSPIPPPLPPEVRAALAPPKLPPPVKPNADTMLRLMSSHATMQGASMAARAAAGSWQETERVWNRDLASTAQTLGLKLPKDAKGRALPGYNFEMDFEEGLLSVVKADQEGGAAPAEQPAPPADEPSSSETPAAPASRPRRPRAPSKPDADLPEKT